jgi:hypothetical protein
MFCVCVENYSQLVVVCGGGVGGVWLCVGVGGINGKNGKNGMRCGKWLILKGLMFPVFFPVFRPVCAGLPSLFPALSLYPPYPVGCLTLQAGL